MGKRRRRRTKRTFKIESIVYTGFFIILALGLIVNLIAFILDRILTFFQQLDSLGWTYVFLTLIGLGLLFWMSKQHEKRAKEDRLYQKKLIHEEYKRKQLIRMKEKATLETLKTMDPFQFEEFIKDLYELMGYNSELTRKTGDGGKDVIVKKENENSIIECKRFNTPKVTRPHIQKFHSAIIDTKSTKGYFITTGEFTKPAIEYCMDKPIDLINGDALVKLIHQTTNQHEKNMDNPMVLESLQLFEGEPTS